MYHIKIISVRESSIKAGYLPKYTIQIRMDGASEALKQDDKLIEELNMCLENTPLGVSGLEVMESCIECGNDTLFSKLGLCKKCGK